MPPEAITEADPLAFPQVDCMNEVVREIAVGCVTVVIAVVIHPFASVIVHVYVPAINPDALAVFPHEGAHE